MTKVVKLLERMRNSKYGWRASDLHILYTGFGFCFREGGKHMIYYPKKYPELRATVARHSSIPVGYIQYAIKLIDQLRVKEGEEK